MFFICEIIPGFNKGNILLLLFCFLIKKSWYWSGVRLSPLISHTGWSRTEGWFLARLRSGRQHIYAALLRMDGSVLHVVNTEGDSDLGVKDIDNALADSILIPYVKKNFKEDKILASEKKVAMLREALKGYAESAKIQLTIAASAEKLSDLGELAAMTQAGR